jgi:hypothetical protein
VPSFAITASLFTSLRAYSDQTDKFWEESAIIHDHIGDVRINGESFAEDVSFSQEILVETGSASEVLLTIGSDGYLVGPDSHIRFTYINGYRRLNITSGSLNAVIDRNEDGGRFFLDSSFTEVEVNKAVFYFATKKKKDYICTCHGVVRIKAKYGQEAEHIVAKQHDSPRLIYAEHRSGRLIRPAIARNHSNLEVGRILSARGQDLIHASFLRSDIRSRRKLF